MKYKVIMMSQMGEYPVYCKDEKELDEWLERVKEEHPYFTVWTVKKIKNKKEVK